jgi:hypothetical protein
VKKIRVKLESNEWVDAWAVAKAIGQALHPNPAHLEGVELIRSKILFVEGVPPVPLLLSELERAQLRDLLTDLPRVHGRMTEEEKSAFLEAFRTLPSKVKPSWEPCLPSNADLYGMYTEAYSAIAAHMAGISAHVQQGLIDARDPHHRAPEERVGPNTLLRRAGVIDYLESCEFIALSEDDSNAVSQADTAASEESGTTGEQVIGPPPRSSRDRPDALTPAVLKAMGASLNRYHAPTVWVTFTEMARRGDPPLTGIDKDNCVTWHSPKNRKEPITYEALAARIGRIKKKEAEPNTEKIEPPPTLADD